MSIRLTQLIVLLKSFIFLHTFLSRILSIIEKGLLKSLSVITGLSISSYNSRSFCLMHFQLCY